MPKGLLGVVGSSGNSGGAAGTVTQILSGSSGTPVAAPPTPPSLVGGGDASARADALTGQGAQFVYVAATVANVLTDNLNPTQINLLANFLSVVTTCVYAILTVENPTDILQG